MTPDRKKVKTQTTLEIPMHTLPERTGSAIFIAISLVLMASTFAHAGDDSRIIRDALRTAGLAYDDHLDAKSKEKREQAKVERDKIRANAKIERERIRSEARIKRDQIRYGRSQSGQQAESQRLGQLVANANESAWRAKVAANQAEARTQRLEGLVEKLLKENQKLKAENARIQALIQKQQVQKQPASAPVPQAKSSVQNNDMAKDRAKLDKILKQQPSSRATP